MVLPLWYPTSPAIGGRPGRELGLESGYEVGASLQLAASAFAATSFTPSQHPHQPITERRFGVDYEILIVCPPNFNCISESAKLSQCGAAWLPFTPWRIEKLQKQDCKVHVRKKQRVEVGSSAGHGDSAARKGLSM